MATADESGRQLEQLFSPSETRRRDDIQTNKGRFVYYTTADTAAKIITKGEVWMRRPTTMNDYSEVWHGRNCLVAAWKSPLGVEMQGALNNAHPGIVDEVTNHFNEQFADLLTGTYIACVSEHREEEDAYGRLSMWRAYGNGAGVAFVLNNTAFVSTTDVLHAYSTPVEYYDAPQFKGHFDRVARSIIGAEQMLKSADPADVRWHLSYMLRSMALCTKHPGFREELEWRIAYTPNVKRSALMRESLETIHGIPQAVVKMPLKDIPADGLTGVGIPTLVDRVVIGPTQYPQATAEAFVRLLVEAGMQDARSRVHVSDIPVRQA
jgi:hypothetical protein